MHDSGLLQWGAEVTEGPDILSLDLWQRSQQEQIPNRQLPDNDWAWQGINVNTVVWDIWFL